MVGMVGMVEGELEGDVGRVTGSGMVDL